MTRPLPLRAEAGPAQGLSASYGARVIACPFCGARPRSEFEKLSGPIATPSLDASRARWFDALYLSDAPRAAATAATHWAHMAGCGAVIAVTQGESAPASPGVAAALAPRQSPSPRKRAVAKTKAGKARNARGRRRLAS